MAAISDVMYVPPAITLRTAAKSSLTGERIKT
jgi:hypothetical protein